MIAESASPSKAQAAPALAFPGEASTPGATARRPAPPLAFWVGLGVAVAVILCALLAPWLAPHPPLRQNLDARLAAPGGAHLLGTDELGRDILSRLIYGSRISLAMAIGAMGLALPLGSLIGLTAGFAGGWIDTILGRVIDVLLAFPTTLLALVLIASLGPSPSSVIVALGLAFLPSFARIARGAVIRERERDYVLAARAIGQAPSGIVWRHVRPNVTGDLAVQLSVALPAAMLAEAGLSFLGLGVSPADPSWGRMLSNAAAVLHTAPHVALAPLIPLVVAVLGFFLLADGTRAWIDPQTRRGRYL